MINCIVSQLRHTILHMLFYHYFWVYGLLATISLICNIWFLGIWVEIKWTSFTGTIHCTNIILHLQFAPIQADFQTWFIRPGHLLQLLQGPVVMLTCPLLHFCGGSGVSMGTLTDLWLCSPVCNKLRCTVYSDTFLPELALTSSAIWATVARLLVRTTRASLRTPRASLSLGHPWPYHLFPTVSSLDHFG